MSNSTASRLAELQGLTGAKRAVLRLASSSEVSHAVLLYGSEGVGKRSLAEALAKAWLCKQPTEEGACGVCQACQAYERDRAADLLRIHPMPPSNIIRKGFIRYDPLERENPVPLIDFLRTPPLYSRAKVAIIYDADRMMQTAAHALLKTLEEPHEHGKLILTTSYIGAVLPTIISRCLAIACEMPESSEMVQACNPDELAMSEGAPGRLADIRAKGDAYRHLAQFMKDLAKAPAESALTQAEHFRQIVEELEKASGLTARAAQVEALRTMGSCLPGGSLKARWAPLIAEAHRRVQGNVQSTLVFDALFARMLRERA